MCMAKRRSRKEVDDLRHIAEERIAILFQHAEQEFPTRPELANRYVELARKIAMRMQVPIRPDFSMKYCKGCNSYLVIGKTVRIRLQPEKGYMLYTCLNCGNKRKFGYTEERKAKRQKQAP